MEEADQDKPEEPTAFKLKRAREKGQVARGGDLGFLGGLTAFLAYCWVFGPAHAAAIAHAARRAIIAGATLPPSPHEVLAVTGLMLSTIVVPLLVLGTAVFTTVMILEFAQTGVVFSGQPLKPDFNRLNPAKGLKRIFSVQMLAQTGKNMIKMVVYSGLAYLVIRHALDGIGSTISDGRRLAEAMAAMAFLLLLWAAGSALVFAGLDQFLVRRDFRKKMRMSRRELKREVRDREGEPRMKQRRKQLHGEFAQMSESMRNLKGADVLIVNPDHLAVGLRYDRETMAAPRVVSRGRNLLAERLKAIALVYGVAVIRDPQLARALYREASFDREIPDGLYRDVAAIYRRLAPEPHSA